MGCFAGAARHNEFAPVGSGEMIMRIVDSGLLVRLDFFFGCACRFAGYALLKACPVNRGALQVVEIDSCNRRVLVLDGLIGVRAPLVGG